MNPKIGIIGGSGVYDIDGLETARWQTVETPWGAPSDQILTGRLNGCDMAFLPRHGRGHVHSPGSVPYRANIDALKRLGVTHLIAVSACGSLKEDMVPGDLVVVDQYVDRTLAREKSFFGIGCVAHVSLAHPTCPQLSAICAQAARDQHIRVHEGGTYLAMEGPQFSTLAESRLYRSWGCDVIGMTGMPEAKLAREAEICYSSLAMVTDYDCWHPDHDAVDVAAVIAVLQMNAVAARAVVARIPAMQGQIHVPCPHRCDVALDSAIITAPAQRNPLVMAKLDAVAGRILKP